MQRFIGTFAIVAIIAIVGFIFRDRIGGNAGELRVGDCFDEPVGTQEIDDVQHHPCSEAHDVEVFLVTDHPAAKDARIPTEDEYGTWVESACLPAFRTYTGRDPFTDALIGMGWYVPADDAWESGERRIICFAGRQDGAKTTGSVKAGS